MQHCSFFPFLHANEVKWNHSVFLLLMKRALYGRNLRAFRRFMGPYKAFKGPQGPYEAIKGIIITPLRAL